MRKYEVHKNTMNDYKFITFNAPWSGRYKYSPQTENGVTWYKAMVMSSGRVHLWVCTHRFGWGAPRSADWQLLKEIDVDGRIGREDFDALYEIVQEYL